MFLDSYLLVLLAARPEGREACALVLETAGSGMAESRYPCKNAEGGLKQAK